MSDRHTEVYEVETAQHPAARAWAQIGADLSDLRSVVLLERLNVNLRRSAVYRLEGIGENGAPIIAKKCRREPALLERTIYERVLANLSVPHPRFLGMTSDEDGISCWLFTEDAGDEAYSPLDPMHRAMAGRWLGALHASTMSLPSDVCLPERGPVQYLRHLQSAREAIRDNLKNPVLDEGQQRQLKRIVSTCEFVEQEWHRIDQFCGEMPQTLVHGDFVGKNVRVTNGCTAAELLPFDWEHAGRGVPAVDLAQAFSSTTFLANPDLDAYCATVNWTAVGFEAVRRLAVYGTIFRCLAALHWESHRLAYDWVEWPVKNMGLYEAELEKAVRAAGLR
jgi:aminoglycoside phosphotransferase (APT) family kinase protein